MAIYINQPTIDIDFLKARKYSFNTPGGGLEGGRNGLGESITIGLSGGPLVTAEYQGCYVQAREEHEYVNWLAARLNNSFRFVNVPINTDWSGPFPTINGVPRSIVGGVPHSDGALFSDGAGYSQATVYATVVEAASYGAGVVRIQVFGAGRLLRWSDWFSFYHAIKGWRVTRFWEVRDIDNPEAEAPIYTLAIEVPLRESISVGERVEFARPRCVMKFPSGFLLPSEAEGFWRANPNLQFTEAF